MNMLETYFSASKMLGHLRSGPSGPYLDGFAAALDAMESIVPPHLRRGVFQPSDKLIALLKRPS